MSAHTVQRLRLRFYSMGRMAKRLPASRGASWRNGCTVATVMRRRAGRCQKAAGVAWAQLPNQAPAQPRDPLPFAMTGHGSTRDCSETANACSGRRLKLSQGLHGVCAQQRRHSRPCGKSSKRNARRPEDVVGGGYKLSTCMAYIVLCFDTTRRHAFV